MSASPSRSWIVGVFSMLALVLLPASAAAKGPVPVSPLAGTPPIYVVDPVYGRTLSPLDPATLAADPGVSAITLGLMPLSSLPLDGESHPQVITSPNDSLIAVVSNRCEGCQGLVAKYLTIRIVTATGRQLAAFHPRVALSVSYVSNDGKVIAGEGGQKSQSGPSIPVWYTLNVRDGKVISTAPSSWGMYDPALNRLYEPVTVHGSHLELAAYDARSGAQLAAVDLPSVADGGQVTAEVDGRSVLEYQSPGVALSPDGRQIAIVDGFNEMLTILDAQQMRVLRTMAITQPESLLQRFGEALGILPSVAEAKGPARGVLLAASYSRDGKTLFVSGYRAQPAATWPATDYVSLGLRSIDASSGQVIADQQGIGFTDSVLQSIDGRALYVLGTDTADSEGPFTLRSLDASTLEVVGQRQFSVPPTLVSLQTVG